VECGSGLFDSNLCWNAEFRMILIGIENFTLKVAILSISLDEANGHKGNAMGHIEKVWWMMMISILRDILVGPVHESWVVLCCHLMTYRLEGLYIEILHIWEACGWWCLYQHSIHCLL